MIHQFKNNGYNVVIDINSGAIHVVDDITYDYLALWQEQGEEAATATIKENHKEVSSEEIDKIRSEINQLIEDGSLFTEDNYEPRIVDFTARPTVVKALCLHITHDCNLACKYCFAEEGEYHTGKRELMSYEVGKQALDFLVANSGSRRNLEVDFFGGEPLMNWQVVKDLVVYGRSLEKEHDKNFRFTLTTNGVLLNNEVKEFVNKEM
ncbi:MAG: 4Fe-4S cluster-binding domain-containing protein, partial [Pseudobutyrivibrio sp.]|nr:4Fe-4S cluster-binding domain-containing protein [Pseudobutyrivibrio sp.]